MKPVAWSCWNEDMVDLPAVILFTEPNKYEWQSIQPLYTTPQTKPLSDDEILNAIKKSDFPLAELSESAVRGMTNFARAIEDKHGIR